MIYNTKNSRKFLQIKTLVLPLLFFVTAAQAYIYKVDLLVNEQTGQEIICLSDWHKYPTHWKETEKENIAREQQKAIIQFAKTLQATIVVEASAEEAFLLEYFPKHHKKALRELAEKVGGNEIKTPLNLLYSRSIVNNIPCKNVECRITPACFDPHKKTSCFQTLQEILAKAQETAEKIAQFNDEEPFQKIYKEELGNFNNLYSILEKLTTRLGELNNLPIDELATSVENQEITLKNDVLYVIANLSGNHNCSMYNLQAIAENIKHINTFFANFVDMYILHAIAQNKQIPIIVAAGGDHICHVVQRLQECGYAIKKSTKRDTILLSALNPKTILNNLERAKSNYYVQKIKNFFRHPWKKIGYLALAAAGAYAATCWLSK